MEYPKINTIWKREDPRLPGSKGNGKIHSIIEGDYACPEFAAIKQWHVEEKIDGTNIRIYINKINPPRFVTISSLNSNLFETNGCSIEIKGKTANAQIPPKLLKWFNSYCPTILKNLDAIKSDSAILYGEGFGAGIQTGGIYRPDISFILFDCYMNGRWSTREELHTLALALELEKPHDFGLMYESNIIDFVKSKPNGLYGNKNYTIEGVVCRSEPLVRFNTQNAEPIIWKLKVKDFN